ncbi:hypothetical protein Bca52824_023494 [Brassica carinata]|uniref:Uncharacterized protein n=1 Tax=Brassica carinata TaxID=52824 RepID=A0A8X8AVQ8_BRACI|nr:hypothetical protein Bca52824_023494 [Brassica carinata]
MIGAEMVLSIPLESRFLFLAADARSMLRDLIAVLFLGPKLSLCSVRTITLESGSSILTFEHLLLPRLIPLHLLVFFMEMVGAEYGNMENSYALNMVAKYWVKTVISKSTAKDPSKLKDFPRTTNGERSATENPWRQRTPAPARCHAGLAHAAQKSGLRRADFLYLQDVEPELNRRTVTAGRSGGDGFRDGDLFQDGNRGGFIGFSR